MVDEQTKDTTQDSESESAGRQPEAPAASTERPEASAASDQPAAPESTPPAAGAPPRSPRPYGPSQGGVPYRRPDQGPMGSNGRPPDRPQTGGPGQGYAPRTYGPPRPIDPSRQPGNVAGPQQGPQGSGPVDQTGQRPPFRPTGPRPPQAQQPGGPGGQAGPGQSGPGSRWVDLGSKPQPPRTFQGPAQGPGQAGPLGPGFGPPRPRTFGPGAPSTGPRPFVPGQGAPGAVGPGGPRPFPPRPWTPRPPAGPFGAPPAGGRPDSKDWIRSKADARRRGAKKPKGKVETSPEDAAAKRKLGPDGKPRATVIGKPRPMSLRPRGDAAVLGARPIKPAPGTAAAEAAAELDKTIRLPRVLTVKDLAETLDVNAVDVIKSLMQNGIMASINQVIDYDTAEIIAGDLGFQVKPVAGLTAEPETAEAKAEARPARRRILEGDEGNQLPRPPVVTIMGHVDHGKTSLLDAIRQTNVIATEAGGITQHIGAYQVEKNDHKITFLDTPGHEAFTAMRARGAQVTDIAILVVAADDGVQPQTLEALNHARAAQVPIIVAMNKIDKEGANPDRVKQQLSDAGLLVEDWGGDTVTVPVSAKKKIGIDQLLEMILLVAEMQDLRANPNRPAVGAIVEAQMDKAKGPMATVLVQHGTLKLGDTVLVGETFGKIKAMFNDKGKRIRKAEPATPVSILGLPEVPSAGDTLEAVADEKTARALAMDRTEKRQRAEAGPGVKVSLDDLFAQIQAGNVKELNIILKADVQGSVEPIVNSLNKLGDEKVKVKVIHTGIGAVRESDVALAAASKAIVVGFNERMDPAAKQVADTLGVDVRFYDVIYNLVDDVQKALQGLYEPKYQDVLEGKAEVRTVFKVGKSGAVAGSFVLEGPITRSSSARVLRDGKVIFTGKIAGLRRFKDDVREVERGYECGITLEGFADFQEKDVIETYRKERV